MVQNPLKLLLIEAELPHSQHIRRLLADTRATQTHVPAFELLQTDNLDTAVAYLKNIHFDLVLVGIPAGKGQAWLSQIQDAMTSPTPVILIGDGAEDGRHDNGRWAIQQGAQEFLPRHHLTHDTLTRAIWSAIERHCLLTTQREREKELTTQHNHYRQIVEKNADGIVVVTKQAIVLYANAAAAHILQQERSTLINAKFTLPLPRKDTAEFSISRGDDQTSFIEMRLAEIEWDGERVYQVSLRDITTHQRAKAAMREKAAELEVRNIALDEFAHTMAHQVQGLLSQMVGYASYVEMEYGPTHDDQFRMLIGRIVQSGHKMNNVISELLLLASIRGGSVAVEPLNMRRVVAEALKRLRYQVEQSKVEIVQPAAWPLALGYGSWIEEAWVNYISNGIKYGGSPPRIECGATPMPNGMVRFWVKDNGVGIPEIDQKLLFKPHTRLGPKEVRGEGLGLSIVRRIVAKCGGQVGVESHEGEGSLFWFSLPAAETAASDEVAATAVSTHDPS